MRYPLSVFRLVKVIGKKVRMVSYRIPDAVNNRVVEIRRMDLKRPRMVPEKSMPRTASKAS